MSTVLALINITIGHGSQVREIKPGDLVELSADEATIWCLREWADPVEARMVSKENQG